MACVNITNVGVLDNPATFLNPFQAWACRSFPSPPLPPLTVLAPPCVRLRARTCASCPMSRRWTHGATSLAPRQFEIAFECIAPLDDDIEWKLVYVGSAESDQHDQLLDSICVGPMQASDEAVPHRTLPAVRTPLPSEPPLHVASRGAAVARRPRGSSAPVGGPVSHVVHLAMPRACAQPHTDGRTSPPGLTVAPHRRRVLDRWAATRLSSRPRRPTRAGSRTTICWASPSSCSPASTRTRRRARAHRPSSPPLRHRRPHPIRCSPASPGVLAPPRLPVSLRLPPHHTARTRASRCGTR